MRRVAESKPLVHHITNYVTVNDCANICICSGGSPVMTDEAKDIPQMVGFASSVVLNIGTLNERTVDSMILAGKCANEKNIPVILDPVGAGATEYRTSVTEIILNEVKVSVIKGNGGEISVLSGMGGEVKGVDSVSGPDGSSPAEILAGITGAVVAASGPVDYVSDGKKTYVLSNGCDYMSAVSGTGCMLSSVVGTYVGACGPDVGSVATALAIFSVAGEIAGEKAFGPGSFKTKLFDSLYSLKAKTVSEKIKLTEKDVKAS